MWAGRKFYFMNLCGPAALPWSLLCAWAVVELSAPVLITAILVCIVTLTVISIPWYRGTRGVVAYKRMLQPRVNGYHLRVFTLDVAQYFHYTHPKMIGKNRTNATASPAQKPNKILHRVFIAPLRIRIDQLAHLFDLAGIGITHLV